jgi:hypothetical protein
MIITDLSRWERTRTLGRSRFIWAVGVLGAGLSSCLLLNVLFVLDDWDRPDFRIKCIVVSVSWPILGYAWGAAMWRAMEAKRMHAVALSLTLETRLDKPPVLPDSMERSEQIQVLPTPAKDPALITPIEATQTRSKSVLRILWPMYAFILVLAVLLYCVVHAKKADEGPVKGEYYFLDLHTK